jgi:hypothetical protein
MPALPAPMAAYPLFFRRAGEVVGPAKAHQRPGRRVLRRRFPFLLASQSPRGKGGESRCSRSPPKTFLDAA